MLRIQIKDLGRALRRAVSATRGLSRKASAPDPQFWAAAWSLGHALRPIVSEPLAYVFSSSSYRRFKDDLTWPAPILEQPPKNRFEALMLYHESLRTVPAGFAQNLRAWTAGALSAAWNPVGGGMGPEREWTCSYLTQMKYPGKFPAALVKAEQIHLASYTAFWSGDLPTLADECSRREEAEHLPEFWRGFLEWHAGRPVETTDRRLLSVLSDSREGRGKRKTALLLLWTRSGLSGRELLKVTERFGKLLPRAIGFNGSPELPVAATGMPSRPVAETLADLKRNVEAKDLGGDSFKRKAILRKVHELMGATALPTSIAEQVQRLTDPGLRAIVTGGTERERLRALRLLALFSGYAEPKWREWSPLDAKRQRAQFRSEIQKWRNGEVADDSLLASLRKHVFIARELQLWPEKGVEAFVELLRESASAKSESWRWTDPVLASRDRIPADLHKSPLNRLLMERLEGGINLDLAPDNPDWMPFYEKITIKELERQTGIADSTIHDKWSFEKINGMPVVRKFGSRNAWHVHRAWLAEKRIQPKTGST